MPIPSLAILAVLAILGNTVSRADRPTKLSLGIISTESSYQMAKGIDPFVEALGAKLGIPIDPYFATDYAGVIEAMRFGKIQFAWMGNKAAMEAVDRAQAEVIAQITRANGEQGYHSLIIVHRDSSIKDIDTLIQRGPELTFGNGDPNSTSGYLIPSYYLWSKRGIDPHTYFKRSRSANHESNCLGVAMKQIDFATCNTEAIDRFKLSKPDLVERLIPIWKSPLIPNDPIVCLSTLDPEFKAELKAALLGFGRLGPNASNERAILAGIQDGWGPMLDSDNNQLLPIRQLDIEKQLQEIRHSKRLAASEKDKRIQILQAEADRLAEFSKMIDYWNGLKAGP